jgi:tRNA(His) guanylyltransferase
MSNAKDSLGDRMKKYEAQGTEVRLIPNLPVMARMDGIAFRTFTKGLARPYDARFSQCMIDAMKALIKEYHADLAYTQSDEITLFWQNADPLTPFLYDGRTHKLISAFTSTVVGSFIRGVSNYLPMKTHIDPKFDCRVWNVPNMVEVYNSFLWREKDATKNSLSMAAQAHYTHKQLHKKQYADLHEMLFQKGINWNDYPAFFKRGTYVRRFQVRKQLTEAELVRIPEHKRESAGIRTEVLCLDAPPILGLKSLTPLLHGGALCTRGDLA